MKNSIFNKEKDYILFISELKLSGEKDGVHFYLFYGAVGIGAFE